MLHITRNRSSVSLSIAIHAVLAILLLAIAAKSGALHAPKSITWINVEPYRPKGVQSDEKEKSRRIVQTAPGQVTQKAPDTVYLGEHNQTVDRQTVSKQKTTEMGDHHPKAQKKSVAIAPTSAPVLPLSKLGVDLIPKNLKTAQEAPAPNQEAFPDAQGAGVPQDYIQGLKESERTALNTKEYLFYGYFQRIRQSLDRTWNLSLRDKLGRLYRSGRALASDVDHITKLLVTLNQTGEITRVQVVEESGTLDLDEAAVKAFNEAGPFPNPPRGLVDATGAVKVRWDFVLRT